MSRNGREREGEREREREREIADPLYNVQISYIKM